MIVIKLHYFWNCGIYTICCKSFIITYDSFSPIFRLNTSAMLVGR
nr:MAG TPA_asm: hypothetical protein [Caudoviricetes sp.]